MKNRIVKFLIGIVFVLFTTSNVYAFSFRNMTLDFVHISDTHITERTDTPYKALGSSKILLKDAIEQINDIVGLDFVMFTGDMVDFASEQNYSEFYSILEDLKYPSLNAFGNHDFSIGGLGQEEVLETVRNHNPNYTFKNTYYAISPKTDYRIIVLDPVIKDEQASNGLLPDYQLEFLDNELQENQDKVILIAMHFPSVEPFSAKEHNLINADEFNEILLKYKNPIIVISGHYHASKIRKIGNLMFVSTPAMVTYPMAFRHIKITNFKDRVHYDFDFISTRLEDIKEQNKQSVISWAGLEGGIRDKNASFTFYKKFPRSADYKRKKIANATKDACATRRELREFLPQKFQNRTNKEKTPFKEKCSNFFNKFKKQKDIAPQVVEPAEFIEQPFENTNRLSPFEEVIDEENEIDAQPLDESTNKNTEQLEVKNEDIQPVANEEATVERAQKITDEDTKKDIKEIEVVTTEKAQENIEPTTQEPEKVQDIIEMPKEEFGIIKAPEYETQIIEAPIEEPIEETAEPTEEETTEPTESVINIEPAQTKETEINSIETIEAEPMEECNLIEDSAQQNLEQNTEQNVEYNENKKSIFSFFKNKFKKEDTIKTDDTQEEIIEQEAPKQTEEIEQTEETQAEEIEQTQETQQEPQEEVIEQTNENIPQNTNENIEQTQETIQETTSAPIEI